MSPRLFRGAILQVVSKGNEEVVREMYAAFRGENPADALPYFSEDVVLDATARPDGTVARVARTSAR
jgi:hypothetical protein